MGNDMAKLIDIKKAISLLLAGTLLLGGCGVKETGNTKEATAEDQFSEEIVIGFSQLGAESDWRTASKSHPYFRAPSCNPSVLPI